MGFNDCYGYNRLLKEEKALLEGFKNFLHSEIKHVAYGIYSVLSRGYDEMVEKDEKAYYDSDAYKTAKAARDKKIKESSGIYKGITEFEHKLGVWVPAKKTLGAETHITHSKPSCENELIYIPISKTDYVAEKAQKYRRKYSDTNTVIGLLFLYLTTDRTLFSWNPEYRDKLENFAYHNYKKPSFSFAESIVSLKEVFPKTIAKGLIDINHIPLVQQHSHIVSSLNTYNNNISTLYVDTAKFPMHERLLGLKIGDTFVFPGINLVYKIIYIY